MQRSADTQAALDGKGAARPLMPGVRCLSFNSSGMDKKARQILFKTYWSSAGWKPKPSTAPQDFEYAQNAGYMFKPVDLTHDEIVEWVIKVRKKVSRRRVADAFLSSLSSRRLDWRSALGSYAIARYFPEHKFTGGITCDVCGDISRRKEAHDLSVLNFERLKWGGVRHVSPIYMAFDLEQFTTTFVSRPNGQDTSIFNMIIKTAGSLEVEARPNDLVKALSEVFSSNEDERRVLVEILGYCGILQPETQKGYLRSYVNYNKREDRPVGKIDWSYPVSWWRGADGINKEALSYWFPSVVMNGGI